MKDFVIQPGDIGLVNSNKSGARAVKFLQTAPTIFQHLWRKIRGTQEIVEFYHVLIFINKDTIIEQQGRVIERDSNKLLNTGNRLLIFRLKEITKVQQEALIFTARESLNGGYGVISCLAKFLTWTTGIIYFARYIHYPNTEICINRTMVWYKKAINYTFGFITPWEITTHLLYKELLKNPDKYIIVYDGVPREDKLSENIV